MQPQEVEVWYILPMIRRNLAKELLNLGLKKSEIAKKLGITKAAVSHYVYDKRGDSARIKGFKKEIKRSAKNIIEGYCVTREIQKLCMLIRKKGLLCKVHKNYDSNIRGNCNFCQKISW
ncbi:MAG: transcriptional regulator [Candidatus Woesearchaeota archaeon]